VTPHHTEISNFKFQMKNEKTSAFLILHLKFEIFNFIVVA